MQATGEHEHGDAAMAGSMVTHSQHTVEHIICRYLTEGKHLTSSIRRHQNDSWLVSAREVETDRMEAEAGSGVRRLLPTWTAKRGCGCIIDPPSLFRLSFGNNLGGL